jgi:hypothetical protein
MQAERGRSHPGFESLPSVASSLTPQQLPAPNPPVQIQEASAQQHTQQQIQPTVTQHQTIQLNTQQQAPASVPQQQHIQIPASYRPQRVSCLGLGCPPLSIPGPPGRPRLSSSPDPPSRFQRKCSQLSRPTKILSSPSSSRPSRTRVHGGGEEKITLDMTKKPTSSRSTHSKTSTSLVQASSAPQILKPSGTSYPTCATCRTHSLLPPLCQPSYR